MASHCRRLTRRIALMPLTDVRFALRSLARSPLVAGAATITLALGIGANTAIFSLANWTLMRGVPGVRDAARVATAYTEQRIPGFDGTLRPPLPASVVAQYAAASRAAESAAGEASVDLQMGSIGGAPAERLSGIMASANYFAVLGATPALGRAFVPEEDRGGPPVVILSHRLWRRAFGADRGVVGRTVPLNGRPYTVVGVAPEGFTGLDLTHEVDLWVPAGVAGFVQRADETGPSTGPRQPAFGQIVLRLRPGVTEAQASAEAARILVDPDRREPPGRARATGVVRAGIGLSRELRAKLTTTIALLMGGVALVLLIACANVANLLLIRGVGRRHEIAIRTSLGADRWRVVRLFLAESFVVSAIAGLLGMLLASWGTTLLAHVRISSALPQFPELAPDGRVLAFACAATLLSALVAGVVPALRGARPAPALALRAGLSADARRSRLRQLLVTTQVALCFVLLGGAGLFVRTVRNLRAIDVGFRADHVLAFALDLRSQGYSGPVASAMTDRLLARIAARPDVQASAIAMSAPFAMGGVMFTGLSQPGRAGPPEYVGGNVVSREYFRALGMPFVRGTTFSAGAAASGEIIVNEALAAKYFPGKPAVGERLGATGGQQLRIVGVVPDAKLHSVREEASPTFYQVYEPGFLDRVTLIVRSTSDHETIVPAIRRLVAEADPDLPMFDVLPLDARLRDSLAAQYASAWLVSLFGVLGMVLAAVGLYGVMAFGVTQRVRELALRVALGARAEQIRDAVLREGLAMALTGVAVGALATYGLARAVAAQLYGVAAFDPVVMAVAALGVLAIGACASWLPARRATHVEPMLVLRGE